MICYKIRRNRRTITLVEIMGKLPRGVTITGIDEARSPDF